MRALNQTDSSMCPSAPDLEMWIIQGTLAWRTLPVRTRNQTSPQEDRWGDSGEIQCGSNFRFTRGIRAVRGGPLRLLSSRESIHPLSVYGQLSLEHRFRFGLNGNGAPNNASSQTKNYEITPFIHSGVTEGSYHSSLFFKLFERSGENCNQ